MQYSPETSSLDRTPCGRSSRILDAAQRIAILASSPPPSWNADREGEPASSSSRSLGLLWLGQHRRRPTSVRACGPDLQGLRYRPRLRATANCSLVMKGPTFESPRLLLAGECTPVHEHSGQHRASVRVPARAPARSVLSEAVSPLVHRPELAVMRPKVGANERRRLELHRHHLRTVIVRVPCEVEHAGVQVDDGDEREV